MWCNNLNVSRNDMKKIGSKVDLKNTMPLTNYIFNEEKS